VYWDNVTGVLNRMHDEKLRNLGSVPDKEISTGTASSLPGF
jgi:hypothetical protein